MSQVKNLQKENIKLKYLNLKYFFSFLLSYVI